MEDNGVDQRQGTRTEGAYHANEVVERPATKHRDAEAAQHDESPDEVLHHFLGVGLGALPQAQADQIAVDHVHRGEKHEGIGERTTAQE
eukprot:10795197-Prorocentrum_lima.AAC.1